MRLLIPSLALALAPSALGQFQETLKLTANDANSFDQLGEAVALHGYRALVGSPLDNPKGFESGAAYYFDSTTGSQLFKLAPLDGTPNDHFGHAVDLEGSIGVIGAPQNDQWRGAVYVYDMSTAKQLFKLKAPNAQQDDRFGDSVHLDGNRVIIGAPLRGGKNRGAAWIFDVTTGQELLELTASDAGDFDWFGSRVALHGNRALVGASVADSPEVDRGAAYIFDAVSGAQLHKLLASDGVADDRFGSAVALHGNRALVGAWGHDGDRGKAYLFDVTSGGELASFTPFDAEVGDTFGQAAAIDQDRLVIGASASDDAGGQSGSVYVFDLASRLQVAKLVASDADSGDRFGRDLDLDGERLIVGAAFNDDNGSNSGSAYVFTALSCQVDRGCDPAVPNSTGLPGVIDVLSCSASQGAQVVGRDLPPNNFGYLLLGSGTGVTQPPGSMGNMCLGGGPIGRYAKDVASSGDAGRIATDLVFGSTGGGSGSLPNPPGGSLAAGQTWGLQYWYRDQGGTSNFTDRVRVTFRP